MTDKSTRRKALQMMAKADGVPKDEAAPAPEGQEEAKPSRFDPELLRVARTRKRAQKG